MKVLIPVPSKRRSPFPVPMGFTPWKVYPVRFESVLSDKDAVISLVTLLNLKNRHFLLMEVDNASHGDILYKI